MLNVAGLGADQPPTSASSATPTAAAAAERAFSFISRGWREVRDSAGADLRLMRSRARELESYLLSSAVSSPEMDFVKRLRPKLTEFRRAYSSPDFSRRVLKLDLSAFRNAIADGTATPMEFGWSWRDEADEEGFKEWEPIKKLRSTLKEFERKNLSVSGEIFGGFNRGEFVEKLKSSMWATTDEYQELKEIPPLDFGELFASFVRQSEPLFQQLGIKRDVCDKLVETLCSRRKNHLTYYSLSPNEGSLVGGENISDDLDLRIASVLQNTGHHIEDTFWNEIPKCEQTDKKRHVAIVTTASLPWMTGTAVNPLFRAAYLAKQAKQDVTLVVPWLCKSDQELVYPTDVTFSSPKEQEAYIRNWLEERVGFKADFRISFYPGKFAKERRSIIPAGDTTQFIPPNAADIAILEEPEHLNWYHHGKRWSERFNHVVGVVHTNYLEYIKRERNGSIQAFFVKHINSWVARAYCHKVLRLSAATQDLPKSVICNVHGVNPKFLEVGDRIAAERERGQQAFSKGAYFLGKMVWAKGYRELIDLLAKHKNDLEGFKLDVYGSGQDSHEVQSTAKSLNLNLNFEKGRDHADDMLVGYKVFINPSISDVLCTATAEALAMGKFVICADHPSNDFFRTFPNCLTYKTSEDFVLKLKEAMAGEPQPLTPEQRYNLSWEAATQRFMECSGIHKVLSEEVNDTREGIKMRKSVSLPNLSDVVDGGLAFAHHCLTGNEILRLSTGAIPGTRDYDKQHCVDLNLLPPQVQHPVYGW